MELGDELGGGRRDNPARAGPRSASLGCGTGRSGGPPQLVGDPRPHLPPGVEADASSRSGTADAGTGREPGAPRAATGPADALT